MQSTWKEAASYFAWIFRIFINWRAVRLSKHSVEYFERLMTSFTYQLNPSLGRWFEWNFTSGTSESLPQNLSHSFNSPFESLQTFMLIWDIIVMFSLNHINILRVARVNKKMIFRYLQARMKFNMPDGNEKFTNRMLKSFTFVTQNSFHYFHGFWIMKRRKKCLLEMLWLTYSSTFSLCCFHRKTKEDVSWKGGSRDRI